LEGFCRTVTHDRATEGKGILFHTLVHGVRGVITGHMKGFSGEVPQNLIDVEGSSRLFRGSSQELALLPYVREATCSGNIFSTDAKLD